MDQPGVLPPDPAELTRRGLTQNLCARNATLYFEHDAEFDRLLQAFRDEHQPVGPTEEYLVQQLTAMFWKARRLGRIETGLLHYQLDMASLDMPTLQPDAQTGEPPPLEAVHDWRTELLGRALQSDCANGNALLKLTLCETFADRMFHRTLQQLRDLQAQRAPP